MRHQSSGSGTTRAALCRKQTRGYIKVDLERKMTCSKRSVTVGADFSYEANAGGSVMGVGAGYGILSGEYGGSTMARQQGAQPIYIAL